MLYLVELDLKTKHSNLNLAIHNLLSIANGEFELVLVWCLVWQTNLDCEQEVKSLGGVLESN